VKLNWKHKYLWLVAAPVLAMLFAGCSGVNTTQSVSPASFFLPGLLKVEPTPDQPDKTVAPQQSVRQVALAQ
jgi:hypothetical protein